MTMPSTPRPGGRSARIQAAVHQAVRELQKEQERAELTVPAIANRADVTPSTIYRRWGDLAQLLADVAIEQLQPDQPPADTGSLQGDLRAWLIEYFEEMSSAPGRAMLRDVLGTPGHANAGKCDGFLRQQIEAINERALARQEVPIDPEKVIQIVVAPLLYRILFANDTPTTQAVEALFERLTMPTKT
ncbi:TetR/AcrR family transcriptional regulator [Halomonas dongshanensis]|uniref:TetR/AcrR family transcriptional regulator n=1 Tax=Halomonas dongshanensis TaxID=2890835 RepID=A0ABT2EAH7_9GAMM|nr:TetR/AcrR family transcriptional regulator [Halomonas dongshanensis]MCS2608529.1 TetR/AcrR family transcriptional regulator [Halomonas dongshanensis]